MTAVGVIAAVLATALPRADEPVLAMDVRPSHRASPRRSGVVNVTDYGATGDGRTDDTRAVQGAISAACRGISAPETVELPAGTYRVSSLSIECNKFHVRGTGGYAILDAAGSQDVLTITGGSGLVENLHVFRSGEGGTGIVLTGGARKGGSGAQNVFRRVRVSGPHAVGIQMDNAYLTTFSDLYVAGCGVGIKDLGVSQATVLQSSNLYKNGIGLDWNSRGLTVLGGAIEQSRVAEVRLGVDRNGPGMASFIGAHFEHNSKEAPTEPMITVGPPNRSSVSFATFSGCSFWGNSANRTALRVQGGGALVQGTYFQDFEPGNAPVIAIGPLARATTILPNVWHESVAAARKSIDPSAQVLDFDVSDRELDSAGRERGAMPGGDVSRATDPSQGRIVTRSSSRIVATKFGASVSIDARTGDVFDIVATDGRQFAVMDPKGAVPGQQLTFRIANRSGGALGRVVWGSAYRFAGAWVNPGQRASRSITFLYDSSGFATELSRVAADCAD